MPWSDIDLIIMRKQGLQEQSKFKVSTDLLGQLEAKLKVQFGSNLRRALTSSQK